MDTESAIACPKCGFPSTRADVCEACGALINRIRNRQGTATPASPARVSATPGASNDERVRMSALAYESPISVGLIIKILLVVLVVGGGYLGIKRYNQSGAPSAHYVHDFEQSMFDSEVIGSKTRETWVINFFATSSGSGKSFATEFDATADTLSSKASFARVDVDVSPGLARRYQIQSTPAVIMFRSGKVVAQSGTLSKDDFEKWVTSNL